MSDCGKVIVDAEALIKWLDEGDAWQKRGRELLSEGYSPNITEKPAGGSWQNEPATERQTGFLKNHGISPKSDLTKGDASALIESIIKKEKAKL